MVRGTRSANLLGGVELMREKSHQITGRTAAVFASALRAKEYSEGTIANYLRSVRAFAAWSGGRASRSRTAGWKAHLAGSHAPATVNTILAGVNCFFVAMGWEECRVKPLRVQRRSFQDPERELGRERLALLMETICATGIRVSEVPYITVEAAQAGTTSISLKGKVRTTGAEHIRQMERLHLLC